MATGACHQGVNSPRAHQTDQFGDVPRTHNDGLCDSGQQNCKNWLKNAENQKKILKNQISRPNFQKFLSFRKFSVFFTCNPIKYYKKSQFCANALWISSNSWKNQKNDLKKQKSLEKVDILIENYDFQGILLWNHVDYHFSVVFQWNPRGYHLARKTAPRLTHVSPVWFHMEPVYDDNGEIADVVIKGDENINTDFTKYLRKENPKIKIVPRFRFAPSEFPDPLKTQRMMEKEVLVRNIAIKIVKLCKKKRFDGLVLEILDVVYAGDDRKALEIVLEGIGAMGDMFRKHELHAILSMPPPVKFKEDGHYS